MLALISLLLLAQAPPDVQTAKDALPPHSILSVQGGKQACFQLEPYKLLLGQSHERLLLFEEAKLLKLQVGSLRDEVGHLEKALKVKEAEVGHWRSEQERLYEKWVEENRLRHLAEQKAASPWPIVQVVVGGLLGITGSLWGLADPENAAPWILTGSGAVVLSVGVIDLID